MGGHWWCFCIVARTYDIGKYYTIVHYIVFVHSIWVGTNGLSFLRLLLLGLILNSLNYGYYCVSSCLQITDVHSSSFTWNKTFSMFCLSPILPLTRENVFVPQSEVLFCDQLRILRPYVLWQKLFVLSVLPPTLKDVILT